MKMFKIKSTKSDLFWSNTQGWVEEFTDESILDKIEKEELNLPMGGEWVSITIN